MIFYDTLHIYILHHQTIRAMDNMIRCMLVKWSGITASKSKGNAESTGFWSLVAFPHGVSSWYTSEYVDTPAP